MEPLAEAPAHAELEPHLRDELSNWMGAEASEQLQLVMQQVAQAAEAPAAELGTRAALAASEAPGVHDTGDADGPVEASQAMPSASQVPEGGYSMNKAYVESVWACDSFSGALVIKQGGAGQIARMMLYKKDVCLKFRARENAPRLTLMEPHILWELRNSCCSVRVLGHASSNLVCPTATILALEWCEVTPWAAKRIAGGLAEAVQLLATGFESIQQMHAKLIVHLNLEPAHWLLVGAEGAQRVIMCGFGHARQLRLHATSFELPGSALSTCNQNYLAPEARDAVEARAGTPAHSIRSFVTDLDVFAAGAAALHLLTGLPLSADELHALGCNTIDRDQPSERARMVVEQHGGFLDRMTAALASTYELAQGAAATAAGQLLEVLGPCLAAVPAERPLAAAVAEALKQLSQSM